MIHEEEADDDEDLDDSDLPETADDADSVDTEPCPRCHKAIYAQAEICPHCGSYISLEDSTSRKPIWLIVGVVVIIAAFLLTWVIQR